MHRTFITRWGICTSCPPEEQLRGKLAACRHAQKKRKAVHGISSFVYLANGIVTGGASPRVVPGPLIVGRGRVVGGESAADLCIDLGVADEPVIAAGGVRANARPGRVGGWKKGAVSFSAPTLHAMAG